MVFYTIDFATNKDTFSIDSAIGKNFDTLAKLRKFMRRNKIFMVDVSKRTDDGLTNLGQFAVCVDGSCDKV